MNNPTDAFTKRLPIVSAHCSISCPFCICPWYFATRTSSIHHRYNECHQSCDLQESPSPSLQIDPELAEAIVQNTRRYVTIFSEVVSELLPVYRQKEVYMWAEFQLHQTKFSICTSPSSSRQLGQPSDWLPWCGSLVLMCLWLSCFLGDGQGRTGCVY